MCKVGTYCANVMADPNDATKEIGVCQTLCNAATGTTPMPVMACADSAATCVFCDEQGSCYPSGFNTANPTAATADKTLMGYCMKKCDMFGSDVCPDDGLPTGLTQHQGCWPFNAMDGTGYCREVSPNAGKTGDACKMMHVPFDTRSNCADRLVCLGDPATGNGNCFGWCRTADCVTDTAKCGDCNTTACCTPSCTHPACGPTTDDGCGGKCGCLSTEWCNAGTCATCTNTCAVHPACGADDGCGGKCGCSAGEKCDTASSTCVTCTHSCDVATDGGTAQKCGVATDDGCGVPCTCAAGTKCDTTKSVCVACAPNCINKTCGDDGCGGTCGPCAAPTVCKTADLNSGCTIPSGQTDTSPLEVCQPLP